MTPGSGSERATRGATACCCCPVHRWAYVIPDRVCVCTCVHVCVYDSVWQRVRGKRRDWRFGRRRKAAGMEACNKVVVGALGSCFISHLEPHSHTVCAVCVCLTTIWTSADSTFKTTSRCCFSGLFCLTNVKYQISLHCLRCFAV